MIDTDKYTGHAEGPWKITCYSTQETPPAERKWHVDDGNDDTVASGYYGASMLWGKAQRKNPTARLIADAPDLLAEVKRLYEMMDVLASFYIVKNVEQGFTQREWVELVELAKRGEEE